MSLSDRFAIQDALMTVLDEETALAVIDHRRAKRSPLTKRAAELLAKEFAKCINPVDAANEMIMRGWTGFRPDWVRDRDLTGGRRQQQFLPNKRESFTDAYQQITENLFNEPRTSQANHPSLERLCDSRRH